MCVKLCKKEPFEEIKVFIKQKENFFMASKIAFVVLLLSIGNF